MATSSKRALRRTDGNAVSVYHPTKGYRRVSLKRLAAQAKMGRAIQTWSLIGAALGA